MSDKKERINIHDYLAEFDDIPGTRVFTVHGETHGVATLILGPA